MRALCVIIAVFSAGLVPEAARAQSVAPDPATPSADQRARDDFVAGREAFDAGRYEDALHMFERSHALSGRPALLYNLGAAADRLRRDEEAIAYYERYLEAVPEAANRAFVEERLRLLRQDERETSARVELGPAPAESPAGDDTVLVVLGVVAGVVVVGVGVGIGVGVALSGTDSPYLGSGGFAVATLSFP